MGRRVCSTPGCPVISDQAKCQGCRAKGEQARGTRQARGYDAQHDQLRADLQRRLNDGERMACVNPHCLSPGQPIDPHAWHLGHDPQRRHRGPEHPACNLSEAGRASHG